MLKEPSKAVVQRSFLNSCPQQFAMFFGKRWSPILPKPQVKSMQHQRSRILTQVFFLEIFQLFSIVSLKLCPTLEMLLGSLEDVLMLSLLVFALVGRLSMNCCHYQQIEVFLWSTQDMFLSTMFEVYSCMKRDVASVKRGFVPCNKK